MLDDKVGVLHQGALGRWLLLHFDDFNKAWSGSRWVSVDEDGFPTGDAQACNFADVEETLKYAYSHGFMLVVSRAFAERSREV